MNYIDELFKDVTTWQRKTFPLSDALSKSKHLREEAGELVEALEQNKKLDEVKKEAADILILLFGVVSSLRYDFLDLLQWVEKKMEENKKRKWGAPDQDGLVRHVKDPVSDSRPITEAEADERIQKEKKLQILTAQVERLSNILIRLKERNEYSMEKGIRIIRLIHKLRYEGQLILSQPIPRYPLGQSEHPGGPAIIQTDPDPETGSRELEIWKKSIKGPVNLPQSFGVWVKITDQLKPTPGSRIEIFSPCYSKGDSMRVRIIDEQFLPSCKEATFWRNIIEPYF